MKFNTTKVLKEIKPSSIEEREVKKAVSAFKKKINKDLLKEKAGFVLGGSIAKGTWLRGNHDIDVFIQFKNDENISLRLEKLLNKNFPNTEKVHGSRDYYHVSFSGFIFEVVPVVKIKTVYEAKNVTDCSVFHIKWVAKNSSLKLKDDIRLVKQFLKANGVYGAETHIAGFSGYVSEILTIYFGGFEKFVSGISKLPSGVVIDITKHKRNLDRNKLSPIILIDPVQGDRNAAAALSSEKFDKLKKVCVDYLKNPSAEFFEIKRQNLHKINKKFEFVLEIEPLSGKKDVVGTKVLKVFEFIQEQLNVNGFGFLEGDWEFDAAKSYIWFNVKNKEIERQYIHMGPPISAGEFAESFREKYKGKNVFVQGNKLAVALQREYFTASDFLNFLVSTQYVKDRINGIKRVK